MYNATSNCEYSSVKGRWMKSLKGGIKRRTLVIAALLLIVAALISGLTITAVAGKSQETQTAQSEITISPTPTPAPLLLPRPNISGTESVVQRLYVAGPETRGIEWLIGGKKIKLPEDAELGGVLTTDNGFMLVIIRGNSTMSIDQNTGKVYFCNIARGEEAAFDFIKQAFPDQAQIIDSFAAKASEEVSK
jgi:hypothetical protein